MKIRSAQQISYIYFTVAALSVILFYIGSFHSTFDTVRKLTAKNNIYLLEEIARNNFDRKPGKKHISLTAYTDFFIDESEIPNDIHIPAMLPLRQMVKLDYESHSKIIFYIYKSLINLEDGQHHLYILYGDDTLKNSEVRIIEHQSIIMLVLLWFCFALCILLIRHLMQPITSFTQKISLLKPDEPIDLEPNNMFQTQELFQLKHHFLSYQLRIQELLQRERMFNRYASHELRTPLTIIKGAVQLLQVSDSAENKKRQQQRILQASNDMNDFIEALLSLTKQQVTSTLRSLHYSEIEQILKNYQHLQSDEVQCHIELIEPVTIKVSNSVLYILLGNLIRNAFLYTEQGLINIFIDHSMIRVQDTGIGLEQAKEQSKGFGLGLLLVKDICIQYGYQFSLNSNEQRGCTATIILENSLN